MRPTVFAFALALAACGASEPASDAGADASTEDDGGGCPGQRPGCACVNPGGFGCFEDDMPLRCVSTGGEDGTWQLDPTSLGCASFCDVIAIADGCPCDEEGRVSCDPGGEHGGLECVEGMWESFTDPARCP